MSRQSPLAGYFLVSRISTSPEIEAAFAAVAWSTILLEANRVHLPVLGIRGLPNASRPPSVERPAATLDVRLTWNLAQSASADPKTADKSTKRPGARPTSRAAYKTVGGSLNLTQTMRKRERTGITPPCRCGPPGSGGCGRRHVSRVPFGVRVRQVIGKLAPRASRSARRTETQLIDGHGAGIPVPTSSARAGRAVADVSQAHAVGACANRPTRRRRGGRCSWLIAPGNDDGARSGSARVAVRSVMDPLPGPDAAPHPACSPSTADTGPAQPATMKRRPPISSLAPVAPRVRQHPRRSP